MPKTSQSRQPEAAIKAKPRPKVAQPVPQRAASQPKAKAASATQSKAKAKPAPAVQAKPKAQSRVTTQSKPKTPAPGKARVKAAPVAVPAPTGKLGILVQMLQRPQGASVYDLADAVGWNTNSIRGAMAGSLKARGFVVTSEKPTNTRIYRIAPPPKTSARGRRG